MVFLGISNIISLLSGISLFLFGMTLMGEGLKKVAGNKLEIILYRLSSTPLRGLLLGLGSGLFYALYSIFGRYAINRGYQSLTITFYTFLFCSVGCAFLTDWPAVGAAMTAEPSLWGWVAALGLLTAFFPYLLYSTGLRYVESGKASILASVEPVVGTLLGVFLFREALSLQEIAGIVLVLAAIVVLSSAPFSRKSEQSVNNSVK